MNRVASRNAGSQPLRPAARMRATCAVGVVEEGLQLVEGERALDRVALGLLHVHGGVPLVHHLDRVGAEPGLALAGPAVGRVGQVEAQHPDRLLVAAQRGAAQPADRAQVPEPLIEHGRGPQPRERVGVRGERAGGAFPGGDGGQRQVAGQLLVAPALEHRGEHLLLGAQQRDPVGQVQPGRARHPRPDLHRRSRPSRLALDGRMSHQMRDRQHRSRSTSRRSASDPPAAPAGMP